MIGAHRQGEPPRRPLRPALHGIVAAGRGKTVANLVRGFGDLDITFTFPALKSIEDASSDKNMQS